MTHASRRIAVLTALLALPLAAGATVGVGTASAEEWQYGPVYRAEQSGEGAQYFCNKALSLERASQSYIVVPCTNVPNTDVWYRIVVNPYNWGWRSA